MVKSPATTGMRDYDLVSRTIKIANQGSRREKLRHFSCILEVNGEW